MSLSLMLQLAWFGVHRCFAIDRRNCVSIIFFYLLILLQSSFSSSHQPMIFDHNPSIHQQGSHVQGLHFGCFHVGFEPSHGPNFSATVCCTDGDRILLHPIRPFGHTHQLSLVFRECCTFPFILLAFWTQNQGGLCRRRQFQAMSPSIFIVAA